MGAQTRLETAATTAVGEAVTHLHPAVLMTALMRMPLALHCAARVVAAHAGAVLVVRARPGAAAGAAQQRQDYQHHRRAGNCHVGQVRTHKGPHVCVEWDVVEYGQVAAGEQRGVALEAARLRCAPHFQPDQQHRPRWAPADFSDVCPVTLMLDRGVRRSATLRPHSQCGRAERVLEPLRGG